MVAEVYETKPQGFKAAVEIAACYLEIDGQLLLLECSSSKPEPGKWGVPAGKLEIGETPEQAAKRELFEETGILAESSDIHAIGSLYIRKPEIDYVYHLFQIILKAKPEVRLSSEHPNYLWAIQQEIETLPLMAGALGALQKYRSSLSQKKRITASVNVYLILQKEDQILLQLRQNTGYLDQHWSLAAGHVELGEAATTAMIREAQEELDIHIHPQNLKVVHIMHRKTNRMNVDIFFSCTEWEGKPVNSEPKKCKEIAFFPLNNLPCPMVEYNAFALEAWTQGQFYSEWGFV